MKILDALFTKTRSAVLALFFLNPHQSFHVREVVRRVDSGHSTVQSEVQRLWKAGLLTRRREDRRVEYRANPECFVFDQLRALLDRTAGPVAVLHKALRALRSDIDVAFVYGSVASDTATLASDVDVMVIGRATFAAVVRALSPVQDKLGREVNPSVFPRAEFVTRLRANDPFLRSILAGSKKFVIGDARELAALA